MSEDETAIALSKDEVLSSILSPDPNRNRDEPAIAANISAQLNHMGLDTWSISVIRRLRDAVGRIKPDRIIEVGGGIGHRSAWIYDLIDQDDWQPTRYDIIENGAKFGVIIHRLMTRYKAESWTKIVVGELNSLLAQTNAWSAASKSGIEVGDSPIQSQAEVIIVDSNGKNVANTVKQMLPMLAKGGVLFTVEPLVPAGDVDENDEAGMAVVEGFNSWINLIQSTNETHYIAFNPLFGGTLVAFLEK
jgi:predicted O-methyltransferase YrrM|tara:strand:- start:228 stop:968 length:741 start_codon:yes stop_codon:yes gene_type:complete